MAGLLETLDVSEGLEARRRRHWFDRLMMLSDGVFAIAITFMAVYIGAPDGWTGGASSLWAHLAWQLDAYATSFLVISVYWLAHRRFMAMIVTTDPPATILTLVVLGLVALLPSATHLINAYAQYPSARIAYAGLVVSIGLAMALMWGYASLAAKLVSAEVGVPVRWFLMLLTALTPPLFLLLTLTVPKPSPGAIPAALAVLFVVGWPLRRLMVRWLGGAPHIG